MDCLCKLSCHQKTVRVWLLLLQIVSSWFPICILLLWIGPQEICWIDMERVDNLFLFLISVESLRVSLHYSVLLAVVLLYIAFIMFSIFLVSLFSPKSLSLRDVVFCLTLFWHLMRWSCSFYLSVSLYGVLFWQIFICWTTLASLVWSQLDNAR